MHTTIDPTETTPATLLPATPTATPAAPAQPPLEAPPALPLPAPGSYLRRRRIALGLTLDDLAHLTRIDKSSLSRYERLLREPKGRQRARYAAVLGLSPEDLGAIYYRRDADAAARRAAPTPAVAA